MHGSLVLTQVPRSCPGPSRLTRCEPGGKHSVPRSASLLSPLWRAARVRRQGGVRVAGRGRSHTRRVLLPGSPPPPNPVLSARPSWRSSRTQHTLSSRVTDCRAQRGSRGWGGRPCPDHGEPGSPGARGRLLRVPGPGRASCRGLSPVHHDPQAPCCRCPSFLRRLVDRVALSLGLVLRGTEAIP